MNRLSVCRQFALMLSLLAAPVARAAEPSPAALLPDRVVAYLHVRNTAELAERAKQTALGMAFQDPQVRPLVEHLWSSIVPTLNQFEEKVGMSLDELVAAAPGELVLGLVDVPDARPAGLIMFRPQRPEALEATLDKGRGRLAEIGFAPSPDAVEGAEARILTRDEGPLREIVQLRLDAWHILTTDRQAAGSLVAIWRGERLPLLSDHGPFRTIMARCTDEDSPSQLDWYVDPIGTIRAVTRGNFAAATGLALLPAIGADGLQAVGGQVAVADENYDMITRTHLLMEPPRDGVLRLLALRQGSSQPEAWVPSDVSSYVTWQWDLQQAFATLQELVDSFGGQDRLAGMVQRRFSEPLGVDVQHDVLPLLAGRISQITRIEQPVALNSQATAVGIELKDHARFAESWGKVVEKWGNSVERTNFAGIEVYQLKRTPEANGGEADAPPPGDDADDPGQRRLRRRQAARQRWQGVQPVAALLGDYLIVADRLSLLQHIIMTYDQAQPRLKDELEYKLVVSKLMRHSTTTPGMVRFERPEEVLRMFYQLLQTEDMRRQIHERREQHPFFQAVDELLTENRLPPFDVLAQYLAPGGSMLANEESGFHHVSFGLRRHIEHALISGGAGK